MLFVHCKRFEADIVLDFMRCLMFTVIFLSCLKCSQIKRPFIDILMSINSNDVVMHAYDYGDIFFKDSKVYVKDVQLKVCQSAISAVNM